MNKIDIHCHVVGNGKDITRVDDDVYFNPYDNKKDGKLLGMWALYKAIQAMLLLAGADTSRNFEVSTDEYLDFIYKKLVESGELDGIVLLAMDAVYGSDGELDERRTDLWVSNRYLFEKVRALNDRLGREGIKDKRFYFGASVSPRRKDWQKELAFVIEETDAVLLKWIPSAQHIRLDEVSEDFYTMLAGKEMPLLCHIGPEYSFAEGAAPENMPFDNFERLKKPLDCGVKVIAAHCALPVFPTDKNRFNEFCRFMAAWNKDGTRIWTDTSALSLSTRLHLLKDVKKDLPPEWLVHGSDFPIFIDSGTFLPVLTSDLDWDRYTNICRTHNPFDRDVLIKRAFGFDDSILVNAAAGKVLRL